ncbi:MAG: transcription termination/antitermination protein NusG [Verrucomicrobiota bacterium]
MEEKQQNAQWFVVQTLSGHENKVRDTIEKRRLVEELDDKVVAVEVPTEKVSEVKRGQKTVKDRKSFPGYILVNMQLYTDTGDIDQQVWYFIKGIEGVINIIGGEKPTPLAASEVDKIFAQTEEFEETAKPKVSFEIGETVNIVEGAFENFEGVIESVDNDRGRLRLSVNIFGRSTPVEVEFWQVARG